MSRFGSEQQYSDEELLADLCRVAGIVGRSPTRRDYAERGRANPKTLITRFGSWSDAQERAGLEPTENPIDVEVDPGTGAKYGDVSLADVGLDGGPA